MTECQLHASYPHLLRQLGCIEAVSLPRAIDLRCTGTLIACLMRTKHCSQDLKLDLLGGNVVDFNGDASDSQQLRPHMSRVRCCMFTQL